jgi:Plasmid stabilization system protein
MGSRLAPRAAEDLDDIWYYVAKESGNVDVANRLIDSITARFFLIASQPYLGRARDKDFGPGSRSLPVGEYVIVYSIERGDVLILRVAHGRRDIEELFKN